jgi:hypothetical protein
VDDFEPALRVAVDPVPAPELDVGNLVRPGRGKDLAHDVVRLSLSLGIHSAKTIRVIFNINTIKTIFQQNLSETPENFNIP